MTYKLIGFRRQKGTFSNKDTGEVIDYDNVIFQCSHTPLVDGYYGDQCSDFKVASRFLNLEKPGVIDSLKGMIGREVHFDAIPNGKNIRYVGISLAPEL